MPDPRFLLASASPRRRELLRLLNIPFQVTKTEVDETPRPGETAPILVARLSRLKAEAAQMRYPGHVVIAADTDVEVDGAILGKPHDQDDARAMLYALRGREHVVHGGITISNFDPPLVDSGRSDQVTLVVHTRVWMRSYSDAELDAYVATGDPLDKAAAYAVQHRFFRPVERIEGCFANVMGLALCHLHNALVEHYDLPEPSLDCHLHPGEGCTIARLVEEGAISGN